MPVEGDFPSLAGATEWINSPPLDAKALHGKVVRFRVTIDGKAPADDHGVDTDAGGMGVVKAQRLYQLVRQKGAIRDRTFEVEFLDPGAQAFAFTFG